MEEVNLIQRFTSDPERAYRDLLEHYTPVILNMIRRFFQDPDEVMEVYTSICERLQAYDYQALRRFDPKGVLKPWLSVVVANASRDRLRKRRAQSMPMSVLKQLTDKERLVFTYYYQEHLPHEDIAEIISVRHRTSYTALEVVKAVGKINDLLSVRKRWHLLTALRANQPRLSLDELREGGYQPEADAEGALEEALYRHDWLEQLRSALHALETEDQLLVTLWFEQNRTAPQIAEVLQYENHRYVYTRLRTVINRLRRHLGIDAG